MKNKIIKGGNFLEGMFTSFKKRNWWKTCKKEVEPFLQGFQENLEVSLAFRHLQLGKTQLKEFEAIMMPISSSSVVVFTTTRSSKKPQKEFNTVYFYDEVDWASIVGELAQKGVGHEKLLQKATKRIFGLYGADEKKYILKGYGDFPKKVTNVLGEYKKFSSSSIHIYKHGRGRWAKYKEVSKEAMRKITLLHKMNNNYEISSWLHFKIEEMRGLITLHVFMGERNSGSYNRCYSYHTNLETIEELLNYESIGRGYNRVIKHKMTRCGYFEGNWKREDLPITSFQL